MEPAGARRGGEGHLEARQYDWAKRNSADGGISRLAHGPPRPWLEQPEPRSARSTRRSPRSRARRERGCAGPSDAPKARKLHVFPNSRRGRDFTLMLRTFGLSRPDRTEMK